MRIINTYEKVNLLFCVFFYINAIGQEYYNRINPFDKGSPNAFAINKVDRSEDPVATVGIIVPILYKVLSDSKY